MKKTVLVFIMAVMIVTQCFAQEVEPEGVFSVEGTLWATCGIAFINMPPFISTEPCPNGELGFYPGWEYSYNIIDLGVVSIAYDINQEGYFLAIMQPIGLGVYTSYLREADAFALPVHAFAFGIMYKIDDNWVPPSFIHSINPNSGYQETTLTNVTLFANYTTFQDNPPVEINFDPPDGLTVSNTNVISNTEIEFDLDIKVDAPIGLRHVNVVYDNGSKVIREYYAFEVLERTN